MIGGRRRARLGRERGDRGGVLEAAHVELTTVTHSLAMTVALNHLFPGITSPHFELIEGETRNRNGTKTQHSSWLGWPATNSRRKIGRGGS